MARYTRIQIFDLCNDLERDANTIVSVRPAQAGKMKAASMLLRLLAQLADVQEVETTKETSTFPLVPNNDNRH
jgi:hypothetical protein